MLNEKQMILLGGKFLTQNEDAEFVTVFPDENVFLPKAENHAKAHARDSKLEGFKVTRDMIATESAPIMKVTKPEVTSEKKDASTAGAGTGSKSGNAGNTKKTEQKAPVNSTKSKNPKGKTTEVKTPSTSTEGESLKADVDNSAEKAPAAAVEGERQKTETKVDAATNESGK